VAADIKDSCHWLEIKIIIRKTYVICGVTCLPKNKRKCYENKECNYKKN